MTCRESCRVCKQLTTKLVRSHLCADCAIREDEATIRAALGYEWRVKLNRPLLQRMAIYAGIVAAGMRIFEPTPEEC